MKTKTLLEHICDELDASIEAMRPAVEDANNIADKLAPDDTKEAEFDRAIFLTELMDSANLMCSCQLDVMRRFAWLLLHVHEGEDGEPERGVSFDSGQDRPLGTAH
jgi:hypothetical protein